jgi:hypothetical protein
LHKFRKAWGSGREEGHRFWLSAAILTQFEAGKLRLVGFDTIEGSSKANDWYFALRRTYLSAIVCSLSIDYLARTLQQKRSGFSLFQDTQANKKGYLRP